MSSGRRGRAWQRPVVLGIASVTLVLGSSVTPVSAGVSPAVTVSTVTVSPLSLTLTRLQTGVVTVSLRLVVPDGQRRSYRSGGVTYPLPAVVDHRTGLPAFPATALQPVSGDGKDGVWQASIPVGAVNNGPHDLSVQVCPKTVSCNVTGPLTEPLGSTVTVDGTDAPTIDALRQDPFRLDVGQVSGAAARGTAVFADTKAPAAGVRVLLVRAAGSVGKVADTTGALGRFSSPWPWPTEQFAHLLLVTRVPGAGRVVQDALRLPAPATTFAVHTGSSQAVVAPDTRWTLEGKVTPGVAAAPLGDVVLERRTPGGWRTLDRAPLHPVVRNGTVTSTGSYKLSTSFPESGKVVLRVRKPAALCAGGSCRVAAGHSSRVVVVVGSPTYLVERHLAALRVPVGTVDGVVDARTRQALCAWRDMAGFKPSRDNLTPSLTRSIMSASRLPRPGRSDGLYVDQTCQVLFQVVDHRFRRVVWASTGAPGYETPNGTGAIFRKLEGPVESTLYPGAFMYWPMFFYPSRPAIALHGSVSNDLVLPYPASHGCIRVWRPQIHRIYKESPLGTKVKVYGTY